MYYIYKKQDKICITQNKRVLDKDGFSEYKLILSFQELDMPQVDSDLRFYKILGEPGWWYKYPEDIEKYFLTGEIGKSFRGIRVQDIPGETFKINRIIKILKQTGILPTNTQELSELSDLIQYRADLYSEVDDILGKDVLDKILTYESLSEQQKEFFLKFSNLDSRDKKIDLLTKNIGILSENLNKLLPDWSYLGLSIFSIPTKHQKDISETPDFRNNNRIDGNTNLYKNQESFIRDAVQEKLVLGEVYSGNKIKADLAKIYEDFGFKKKSKVHDIFEYFEASVTRKGYKLISKKL